MVMPQLSKRTWILLGLAICMTGLTLYDRTVGLSYQPVNGSIEPKQTASVPASLRQSSTPPVGSGSIGELERIISNAEVIRQRYRDIAVPYAESVAGFVTLYSPGELPKEKAAAAIRRLVPSEIEIKDMLIAEVPASGRSIWLTATVSLVGGDSRAMISALLELGNAANGMVWQDLAVGVDDERRQISAKGRVRLLMAPFAE